MLDVPAKIADVILYAKSRVQKMTSNPETPRPRRPSRDTPETVLRQGQHS
jgi:hypothetical protein